MEDSNSQPVKIGRFDQVRLLTTRNVKYLSVPGPIKAEPDGIWSVAAAVADDLLLVKNNVTIRIPATDVLKIAEYSLGEITEQLGRLSRGESRKETSTTTKGPN
jgi:hypothetical protein